MALLLQTKTIDGIDEAIFLIREQLDSFELGGIEQAKQMLISLQIDLMNAKVDGYDLREEKPPCKVKWKQIGGLGSCDAAAYCDCGQELDRIRNWEHAVIPNFCPKCGRELVL